MTLPPPRRMKVLLVSLVFPVEEIQAFLRNVFGG